MGDLYPSDLRQIFLAQSIRPIRKNIMIVEGRRMKTRRTVTSEKRMLGAGGRGREVISLDARVTGDL